MPGQVAAAVLRGVLGPSKMNELQFQFSSNRISDTTPDGTLNRQSDYGVTLGEVFPGNATGVMPFITVTGMSQVGANQLFNIEYNNYTVTDSFTWQRGTHSLQGRRPRHASKQKNENAANQTQGNFTFGVGGGRTAFQNFLTGNVDGLCGNACSYSEAQTDVTVDLRFNRYEMFAQDSWRPRVERHRRLRRPLFALSAGHRHEQRPDQFLAGGLRRRPTRRAAPTRRARSSSLGTGDPLNGIIVAGQNSPFGDAIYKFDKSNIQPRIGVTWDPASNGRTIYRGSYGVYFDQALVGIFEQNAFVNPPYVSTVNILNARLSNPASGTTSTTSGVLNLIGNGDDFKTPRTQQWNVGVQRQIYTRGAIDVSYVGTHGDRLIRPIDINYPQPADVLRLGSVNLARPFQGYGSITLRETTARSNYWGILSTFRHDGGAAGSLTLNYTLSRNQTDSTNDRDAVDIPQNPLDLEVEYADARTDRRHIFTANYVYMLPFFKDSSNAAAKAILGRLVDLRHHHDQLRPADVAHPRGHQRLPARQPPQHRRRSGSRRADRQPVLVQPERLRPGGGRHVRQLAARGIPAAGPQPDRPVAVEELDLQQHAADPVPRRPDQRLQPHAVARRPERQRPRQHLQRSA